MVESLHNLLFYTFMSCRETSDGLATSGWKPYGTPLVSSIPCDDVITRGDIQLSVHKMLSPMMRTESLGQTDIKDQCCDISSAEACTDSTITHSLNKDDTTSEAVTLLRLPLQLVDESSACIDLSVGEDEPISLPSSSTSILVYLDWSRALLEKYDTHYLETLPEVFNGPPNKKARTEPLSLYSCLEAFLREEPLVPEDMWLVSSSPPTPTTSTAVATGCFLHYCHEDHVHACVWDI